MKEKTLRQVVREQKQLKEGEMWALRHGKKIIWVGRFQPEKRKLLHCGNRLFWCDCNGVGPIEGSHGAKLCIASATFIRNI